VNTSVSEPGNTIDHGAGTGVTYEVDLLRLGGWDWAPGFEMFWMEPNAPDEPLALVALLLRGGGRTVLVNTGPDTDMLPTLNKAWRSFDPRHQLRVADGERLSNALAGVGSSVDEIDMVIVTPFQPYAIGNLLQLPNADYAISRRGWIDFHAPVRRDHPHDYRPFCIPENILVHLVTDKWPRVRLLADDETIPPGLRVFWVGAHHRSSMAVVIDTREGTVVASDAVFRYENVTENRPLGINESLDETLTAYERIRSEADILVPLYDTRVFDNHPNGIGRGR
jgi:glyoxylase-like metal-dependent hydrolase (beta-lactamase superfamily II)